jgi:hypothetical protein
MLEGLDQIDWTKLGVHVYSSRPITDIPNAIRELLSDSPSTRRAALYFLLGEGQDFGDIYDTTAHIIPFIIEILTANTTLSKRALLEVLAVIARNRFLPAGAATHSIHQMRALLQAYDAVAAGKAVYLQYLIDHRPALRAGAAQVLGGLSDHAADILPVLVNRFPVEEDQSVKINLIQAVSDLLARTDFRQIELRRQYANFFRGIIEDENLSLDIRFTAVEAALAAAVGALWRSPLPPAEITPLAASVLLDDYWRERPNQFATDIRREEIILLFARMEQNPLRDLLADARTTPQQAHTIVWALLANTFFTGSNRIWEYMPRRTLKQPNMTYRLSPFFDAGLLRHNARGKQALNAILDSDQYWEVPTNLLTFILGIQDDRDALRELLSEA